MFSMQRRLFQSSSRCKYCRTSLRRQQFTPDSCSRACWETCVTTAAKGLTAKRACGMRSQRECLSVQRPHGERCCPQVSH